MNWLFEQPLAIVLVGVALLLAIGAAWSVTGRKELLACLGVVLVLMMAGLITERLIITDREAIRLTLQQIARDVASNNIASAVRHIHSAAPELKQKAESEMPNYHFTELRITKIHEIAIEPGEPRRASVEFNVIASGSFREGTIELSDTAVPRWVKLRLAREKDGRWAVEEYEHAPPQQMLFNQPPVP